MLLLNLTTFRYSFLREIIYCMALVLSDIDSQFPGFGKYISSTCTALALPADCPEGSCSSTVVIFDTLFLFSSFLSSNNDFVLFPQIGDKCSSIFNVITHT